MVIPSYRAHLKKFLVDGSTFYLHTDTMSLIQVDPMERSILDATIEGNQEELENLTIAHGEEIVGKVLEELEDICRGEETKADWQPEDIEHEELVLILTEGCNLRCHYCYQRDESTTNGMSEATALQAIDLMLMYSSPDRPIRIRLYGGEPLLQFELIKAIVIYGEDASRKLDRQVDFYITTNGTLMSQEVRKFFAKHNVLVDISIDGPEEIHDLHRRYPNGRGSYEIVEEHTREILSCIPSSNIAISMVVTSESVSSIEESLSHLRAMGLYRVRINPVDTQDPVMAMTEANMQEFARFYKDKVIEFSGYENNPYDYTLFCYWNLVNSKERRMIRCVAGIRSFSVSPDGYLYPCVGFAFINVFPLGHVSRGFDRDRTSEWKKARGTVDESPECRDCWARYYCGGGCYYRAYKEHGDLLTPAYSDCLERRAMIESALRCRLILYKERQINVK